MLVFSVCGLSTNSHYSETRWKHGDPLTVSLVWERKRRKKKGPWVGMRVERMEGDGQKWSDEEAVGTICIQLLWVWWRGALWTRNLVGIDHAARCAVLIGGDLSTQSSYVNAKWIIKSCTCIGLSLSLFLSAVQCSHTGYSNTYATHYLYFWSLETE